MNKKGQLEIGITMMVIIVFLVLLIIALVVYSKFSYLTIKETQQEVLDKKFSTLVSSIIQLPELKCSIRGAERLCLDAEKLTAFGSVMVPGSNIRDYYVDNFGIKDLDVEIVYPSTPRVEFELFHGDDEGLKYTTPISVYFPDNKEYKIGKLIITAEMN